MSSTSQPTSEACQRTCPPRGAALASLGIAATYSYLANSRLLGQIAYARSGQTVMIRTNQYDALNRLVKTETQDAQQAVLASFAYGLNAAHQRTSVTNADGSYWVYQ